jgi:Fe-S-cluster containining protein
LDPGLAGVRPFRFECHRCGRCCTAGEGYVFLAPGEDAALAEALGLELEVFRRLHVREVQHPRSGARVEALREAPNLPPGNGRCSLLEGSNTCSAYAARPAHCASFPYWPSVLGDEAGFERARAVCPGIEEQVPRERFEAAFEELEQLYAEVERVVANSRAVCLARGVCCRFEEAGHELYATALEAEYALARHPERPAPEAPGRCPYHRSSLERPGGTCTAREGRPLGCRTYFCDPGPGAALEVEHEAFLRRVREIEARHGLPAAYARFPELLERRAAGALEREPRP